ncbi:DUF6134 family protein [Lamprobacter modestohalophilus]|uniref:DUF6134 family protein n=1 Tax=Lamprobacter modestohalophilus TaxID=1064514 RepID=UPI002ADEB774|nr:DUF6134 family protein [Lamprobacter modestohalophilus]MEA1050136.1 DUF6134 family protein [Lamprobacter modestohalophilus]
MFNQRVRPALVGGLLALALPLTLTSLAVGASVDQTFRFEVLLDDKLIGEHRFDIDVSGDQQRVTSQAEFEVDFFFITAYRYRHQSNELFRNGCLERLSSTTNDNGTRYKIDGSAVSNGFRVDRGENVEQFDGCVKTFAYWDSAILQQPKLLNPQTGELESVSVQRHGAEQVAVNGSQVEATRFELVTDELTINLWYNDELGWVRLASDTGKGAQLIYRRL